MILLLPLLGLLQHLQELNYTNNKTQINKIQNKTTNKIIKNKINK